MFRLQMSITAQHLPISVAGDKRDLFDGESGLEEPACALVTKVVKVKVLYFQFSALSPRRSANRPCVVRKYASAMAPCETVLLVYDFPGIISTDVQQRDALIVSIFPARILAIPYEEHLVFAVEIRPLDATDFILAHGRRNREANDAAERNLLPWIRVKCCNEAVELVLRWPSVAFATLSNQAKTRECNPSEAYALRRNDDPMDGCCMGQDRLDVTEIDSKRDGTCASAGALLSD